MKNTGKVDEETGLSGNLLLSGAEAMLSLYMSMIMVCVMFWPFVTPELTDLRGVLRQMVSTGGSAS